MRLKWLPLTLAGLHAAIAPLIIWHYEVHHAGLWYVIGLSLVDLPCTLLLEAGNAWWPLFERLTTTHHQLAAFFFLIFGSLWLYFVGRIIRTAINKFFVSIPPEHDMGTCENCRMNFKYSLVHNGFNDSAYAYSDTTCYTCLLDGWTPTPPGVSLTIHKKITPDVEEHLTQAPDGGHFRASAVPRCPHCNEPLDPIKATAYIERNAAGTKDGWRWQQSWDGIYSITIEGRVVQNNWKATA